MWKFIYPRDMVCSRHIIEYILYKNTLNNNNNNNNNNKKELQKTAILGHCTHTAESTNVKVQQIQN